MKYILKKEYPGSPKLGNIIDNLENDWIEYYPEFWEKVVEKDYEILSYLHKITDQVVPSTNFATDIFENEYSIYKIHSVKRLSDSEIFTVGDDVKSLTCNTPNKIISIKIINNKIRLYPRYSFYNLENVIKIKQKLFTTEDGVDIFESDNIYWVNINTFEKVNCNKYNDDLGEISIKSLLSKKYECKANGFSTKEKAEEYILLNKPCLSYGDVQEFLKIKDCNKVLDLVALKIKQSV